MANNPHFKLTTRNAMLDVIPGSLAAAAIFAIYAGGQPADCSAATTAANTCIANLAMTATAFTAAAAGVLTANTITSDSSAVGGTAAWFSLLVTISGVRIADGSVGTSGCDLNLNSVTITTGAAVAISAFTCTLAA